MILHILRGLTLLLVAAISALYLLSNQETGGIGFAGFSVMLLIAVGVGALVIATDMAFRDKKLSSISGVFLGLIVGLIVAWPGWIVIDLVADITAPDITAPQVTVPLPEASVIYTSPPPEASQGPLPPEAAPQRVPDTASTIASETSPPVAAGETGPAITRDETATSSAREVWLKRQTEEHYAQVAQREAYFALFRGVKVILGIITSYLTISLVLQTKDDFRFVIPYVEFAKQIRGNRPTIVDTSVVIDGRIVDIVNTRVLQGTLILPRFMLNELQLVADAGDRIKRTRGRRGLDMLQKLQATNHIEVVIDDTDVEGTGVDQKLVALAQEKRARLLTLDFNLNKVATLRGVDVINLNDLVTALKPVALPGEPVRVKIIKPGENADQGIGYTEDGTMVVVEHGRMHMNHTVEAEVTSTLQTSAGRMIFARYLQEDDAGDSGPIEPPATASPQEEASAVVSVETPAPQAPASPPKPATPASAAKTSKRSRRGGRNPRRQGR